MLRPVHSLLWRLADNRFAREAGAQTGAAAVVAVVTALGGILIARWLGPEGYGVVAVVSAVPGLILTLLSPDSQHATIRFLAGRDAEGDRVGALAACKVSFLADLIVGFATLAILVATADWAEGHLVDVPGTGILLVVAGLGVVFSVPVKTCTSVLVHTRRFGALSVAQAATAVVRTALMMGLVATGHGIAGAVWGSTIGLAAKSMVLGALAGGEARARWGAGWARVRLRSHRTLRSEMVRYLFWTDLAAMFKAIPSQLDVVVLGWLGGVREVGYYRLAKSISVLPQYVVSPLQSVTVPRLARIAAEETRPAMAAALRGHGLLSAVLTGGVLAALVALPVALPMVAGDEYGPTAGICAVLLVAAAIPTVFYWLRPLYMATGHVRRWAAGEAGSALVGLLLYVPAVQVWGAMGMAVVQVGIAAGRNGSALLRIRPILDELPETRQVPSGAPSRDGWDELPASAPVPAHR